MLAITGMVTAIVVAFAIIHISIIVHQRLNDAYEDGDFVAHQIFDSARQALEVDLSSTRVDMEDQNAVRDAAEEALQTDPGLNSLLQSVVGYSLPIYDIALADTEGRALLHTDPNVTLRSQALPQRPDFYNSVIKADLWQQLQVIYGKPRVYEVRLPIERDSQPFGSVRVGISTVFLASDLRPQLNHALAFAGISIFITLILAAALSNLAMRPLALIGRRLDLMAAEAGSLHSESARPEGDEVGAVTTKINRLGQQMRDVKEVFTALKENLDQIMANLQDGLILFTKDARAILVSAAVERFLQVPRAHMLGHNVGEFLFDNNLLGRRVLDAFENHEAIPACEIETEDGRRIQLTLDFIEEGGESIGALMTLRDAESVRRIESEIELSHRLAAIGRLASGVGHEVKNPINAIVVHLEVLRQKMQKADPDTHRHMDVIGSEIQRLDRVVQMLVDFTRPVELRLTDLDLRRTIDEVVLLASPDAERHNVQIARELPNFSLPVRIDADLMKQALLNVVLNGVQAMPEGGTLNISASLDPGAHEVRIDVQDEGTGIPADIQEKIYNLYFTTKKSGTGIGLAMTYKVMQLHQGSVDFETKEGRGTTFHLSLPMLENGIAEPSKELLNKTENSKVAG
jgi:signal transduction histidine kinase